MVPVPKKKNIFVAEKTPYRIFFVICVRFRKGEMLEWLKRHAWKACIRLKRIGGSNPPLSAILNRMKK